jgi:copper chaperone CopZ
METTTRKDTFIIDGMNCGHCVKAVRDALAQFDAVQIHDVEIGTATVSYDSDAVTRDQLVAAIEDMGYEVTG